MKIGIDVDDVLADFIPVFTKICNQMYGRPSLDARPVDWDWSNFDLTKAEINGVWEKIRLTPWFHLNLPKRPDTELLPFLPHTVYFITSRRENVGASPELQTARWLETCYAMPYPTVIISHDKPTLAKALGLEVFIDDRASTCDAMAELGLTSYVLDHPHNQHCDPRVVRVKTFNEFAERYL